MSKSNGPRKASSKSSLSRPQLDVAAYRGRWVAIHPTTYTVLGQGNSLEEARQTAIGAGKLEPVLYFVPKSEAYFVGHGP